MRSKHLSESVLKNIGGVGEKTCARLIKEFGSVEEIKRKSVEELAQVEGISKNFAQKIIYELNKNRP